MSQSPAAPRETARWLRGLGALRGSAPEFAVATVPVEPSELFRDWLEGAVAAGVAEPHAATLATVDAEGVPDARTLLLKDVGPVGWAVAGPLASAKAAQLAARPVAALNFWWQPLVRAVRVRGTVRQGTPAEVRADLAARPAASGLGPDDWMLWWIDPVRVEFWQGAPDRNHTRLVYERRDGSWSHHVERGH